MDSPARKASNQELNGNENSIPGGAEPSLEWYAQERGTAVRLRTRNSRDLRSTSVGRSLLGGGEATVGPRQKEELQRENERTEGHLWIQKKGKGETYQYQIHRAKPAAKGRIPGAKKGTGLEFLEGEPQTKLP